ncbi:hypothetical protein D3C80_1302390 [compost metagenome]
MDCSAMAGRLRLSTKTWRASSRSRLPPQLVQDLLAMYLESSSRTELDSVSR